MPQELIDKLSEEQHEQDFDKEYSLMQMLYCLESDKERCILLFELLREYGYQFDYRSLAKTIHVELRWFMRIKEKMKKRIKQGLPSHISQEQDLY